MDKNIKNSILIVKKNLNKKGQIDKRKTKDLFSLEIAMARVLNSIQDGSLSKRELYKTLGIKK